MKVAHVARRHMVLLAFSVLCSEWVTSSCPSLLPLLRGWCRGGSVCNLPLIHPELQAKKKAKYHNSSILNLNQWSQLDLCACVYVCPFMHLCTHDWCPCMPLPLRATPIDSFVDYIRGGCQISLMVSIDFTVSNNPTTAPALGTVQVLWCIWPYMLSFCCSHWCPQAQIGSL